MASPFNSCRFVVGSSNNLRWRSPFDARDEAIRDGRDGEGALSAQIIENAEVLRGATDSLEAMAIEVIGEAADDEAKNTLALQIQKIKEVEDMLIGMGREMPSWMQGKEEVLSALLAKPAPALPQPRSAA